MPATASARRLRRTLAIVTLGAVYVLTANYTARQSYDTLSTALPAWQLAHHHTWDLTAFRGWSDWIVPADGRWVSNRFPGAILFAVPFYWLGSSAVPTVAPAALAAVTSTLAAVICLYVVLHQVTPRTAFAMSAVFALATPVWSVAADSLWTHGPAMLCLSVLLLGLARDRPAVVAATASLAILCRPHLGLAALAAVTFMLVQTRRRAWTLGVVGLAVGTALLLAYNAAVYGHLTVLGGYDASHLRPFGVGLTKLPENIAGALVSPSRGVFVYSPIVPVLLPFAVDAWRHAETWVKAAAIGGLVYLVVQLYLLRFTGGNRFYSFRVPLETLLLCWPLLALAFEGGLRAGHRLLLTAAAGVSCAITGVGAVTNFISTTEIRPWHQFDLVEASRSLTVQGGLLACVVVTGVSIAVFRAESGEEGRRLADVSPPTPGERLVER